MRTRHLFLLLSILPAAAGCAYLYTGAAVTTVMVAHDRRTLGTVIDDNLIEFKIWEAIRNDPQLKKHAHVNVTSVNGIVLLTGEAPEPGMRDRVIAIARATAQVRQVVNEIRVAGRPTVASRANDGWLTSKVKARLVRTRGLGDAARINVHTAYGVVYLMGLVTQAEGEAAAGAARHVRGVTRVVKVFEYID